MQTILEYGFAVVVALLLCVVAGLIARTISSTLTWMLTISDFGPDSPANRWARTVSSVISAVLTPMVLFMSLAVVLALVSPPPTKVTYSDIAIREDATWFQRNAAWAALNTGWLDTEVSNRFVYTKAKVGDTTFIGLPGLSKWFLISSDAYSVL